MNKSKTPIDEEGFIMKIQKIVSDAHSSGLHLNRINISDILKNVFVACYQHNIKLDAKFVNILLSIGVVEGIGIIYIILYYL